VPAVPSVPASTPPIRPARRRPQAVLRWSLFQQIWRAIFEPISFFRYLATAQDRAWLAAMVLLLALAGFSAVRQSETSTDAGTALPADLPADFGGGDASLFDPSLPAPDNSGGGDFGVDPSLGAPSNPADVGASWVLALRAAANVVLEWLILSLILSLVPMLHGRPPQWARAWRVAVWASLPLGFLLLLQWVYASVGGTLGKAGLSGLLELWDGYASAPPLLQSLLMVLATKLTLFWLWSLWLVSLGARHTLKGNSASALLAVCLWLIAQVGFALLPSLLNPVSLAAL
jgi:hypothetical protein